jgi:hypothetical protein
MYCACMIVNTLWMLVLRIFIGGKIFPVGTWKLLSIVAPSYIYIYTTVRIFWAIYYMLTTETFEEHFRFQRQPFKFPSESFQQLYTEDILFQNLEEILRSRKRKKKCVSHNIYLCPVLILFLSSCYEKKLKSGVWRVGNKIEGWLSGSTLP